MGDVHAGMMPVSHNLLGRARVYWCFTVQWSQSVEGGLRTIRNLLVHRVRGHRCEHRDEIWYTNARHDTTRSIGSRYILFRVKGIYNSVSLVIKPGWSAVKGEAGGPALLFRESCLVQRASC